MEKYNDWTRGEDQVEYIVPIPDCDVPSKYHNTLEKWRSYAREFGYNGPVMWLIKSGFTLKRHAPKAGPCYKEFSYLQRWTFEDKPTEDSLVFWIPRLMNNSTSKTVNEQNVLLVQIRETYQFPEHHCSSFGSASLLAGLILAHFKATGERVPLNRYWVRTDIAYMDCYRLDLGRFGKGGLHCDGCWNDVYLRGGRVGVYALGVEKLGQSVT